MAKDPLMEQLPPIPDPVGSSLPDNYTHAATDDTKPGDSYSTTYNDVTDEIKRQVDSVVEKVDAMAKSVNTLTEMVKKLLVNQPDGGERIRFTDDG